MPGDGTLVCRTFGDWGILSRGVDQRSLFAWQKIWLSFPGPRPAVKKPLTGGARSANKQRRKLQWSGPTRVWPNILFTQKHGEDFPHGFLSHQSTSWLDTTSGPK